MQKFLIATLAIASMTEARRLRDLPQVDEHIQIRADDFEFIAEDGMELTAFLRWANKIGKGYRNSAELKGKLANWTRNNKIIRDANKKARASGKKNPVILDHNRASDLSESELAARLGYRAQEDKRKLAEIEMKDGRHLMGLGDMTVDHSQHTTPVRDQGQCGSCWAFAGNTALEGSYNKYNMSTNPQKLDISDQYPVDCGRADQSVWLFGCDGGEGSRMWDWYSKKNADGSVVNGVLTENEYPYISGITGNHQSCEIQQVSSATKQDIVTEYGTVYTEYDMMQKLVERPLVASFSVNPNHFNFYKFGLIEMGGDECLSGYSQPMLNHQMVITGLDIDGNEGPHQIARQSIYAKYKTGDTCAENEFQWPQYPHLCLYYHTYYETAMMKAGPFWKVQNSWGSDWGHEGFAYFQIAGGLGTCDMNFVGASWVKTSNEL